MSTTVVIYDSAIYAMNLPGGQVWKYGVQRRRSVERIAKAICPKRTGHLAASIEGHWEPSARPDDCIMIVSAGAGYGQWVHEGTEGPITAKAGRLLKLPWAPTVRYGSFATPESMMSSAHQGVGGPTKMGRPGGMIRKYSVRGQLSQPFLRDALEAVMGRL